MRLQNPLAVITPTVDADVLLALANTSRRFTAGELHRLIGQHSHTGIRKVLLRLESEGIVTSERVGSSIAYWLNDDHLAAPAIRDLAQLRSRFLDALRAKFDTWEIHPEYAALFGSAARGEMQSASDIDLFLVRPDDLDPGARQTWDRHLEDLQQDATRATGNDVRILEMSHAEVAAGVADEPVLDSILSEGIVLHGSWRFWRRVHAENRELHTSNA